MLACRHRPSCSAACVLGIWLVSVTATIGQTPGSKPIDATQGIMTAFRQQPVVLIGESHWLRQAGDFYISLIRNRAFQETVQEIVIEFASRNSQATLDKYLAGADVPAAEVSHIWRDTTKVAGWESPIYADLLAAIRDVNTQLRPDHRFRVIAGDTAIDWNRIHSHSDWAALGDNNLSLADAVVTQVLQKGQRALVVLGSNHVMKSGDRNGAPNTTTRIEAAFHGSTYVVLLDYQSLLEESVQSELDSLARGAPALYLLSGTRSGRNPDKRGRRLLSDADALLYLGPPRKLSMASPAPGSLEPSYLKELDRRSMIEWGDLRARKLIAAAAQ